MTQVSTASGPSSDVEVDDLVGEHGGGEVGDGEADMRGADVGGEHHAG